MAQLHARGELALDDDFVNESFIGTRFVGRLVEETTVAGIPAVVPTITGRAWITGTAQYLLDPGTPSRPASSSEPPTCRTFGSTGPDQPLPAGRSGSVPVCPRWPIPGLNSGDAAVSGSGGDPCPGRSRLAEEAVS